MRMVRSWMTLCGLMNSISDLWRYKPLKGAHMETEKQRPRGPTCGEELEWLVSRHHCSSPDCPWCGEYCATEVEAVALLVGRPHNPPKKQPGFHDGPEKDLLVEAAKRLRYWEGLSIAGSPAQYGLRDMATAVEKAIMDQTSVK